MTEKEVQSAESSEATPYAVACGYCNGGKLVFMTHEFYAAQMQAADSKWVCPRCFQNASWSDENFESYMKDEQMEDEDEPEDEDGLDEYDRLETQYADDAAWWAERD